MKIVNAIANLAYLIERTLEIIGNSIFNLIPGSIRKKILHINNEYKSHRNRFLGIGENGKSSSFLKPAFSDDERGDVPGWVLVVLMTTGLVTALWTIAVPLLSEILKSYLDSINNIR